MTATAPRPEPLLAPARRTGAAIAAVAVSVPERVVGNAEVAENIGVSDEWIVRRTGIHSRRIAAPDERLDSHAATAGRAALAEAGLAPETLDLVLVATTTPEEIMPGAAPYVAHAIGAVRAGAFDIGAACTGFVSALAVGSAQIESGRARSALIVGADFMSRITDPHDRSTAAVFADGVGAAVLVATDGPGRIGPIILGADGAGAGHIIVERSDSRIRMRGHETFREAVARLSLATMQAIHAADLRLEEVDLFVYHQANGRILSAVGERLGLPPDRVVDCIGEYGNTSAATLPLALHFSARQGRLSTGDRVLLGAFGAGFTWGATVVEWGLP
ncbi:MAG: beta-ketoacyl-ACP synthase 3 [Solirubrobacterales bacterium]|nr:beta-ketoacyl-ACP synthase 3 [Solirubrobacterales bacterium]MBV9717203.1 beta-ketoacyl-ACP synthase 3 [Solirubrobacterales bacterium]